MYRDAWFEMPASYRLGFLWISLRFPIDWGKWGNGKMGHKQWENGDMGKWENGEIGNQREIPLFVYSMHHTMRINFNSVSL